ncbi:unnamed protein product [Allacma fusca]|uniref:Uncharacterized protein n=1 Tax=Allacma fusca TaxID=39272 RepID=A0A8J2JLW5_9HEXA|nr:unnamed protein product [Allacma fusca]
MVAIQTKNKIADVPQKAKCLAVLDADAGLELANAVVRAAVVVEIAVAAAVDVVAVVVAVAAAVAATISAAAATKDEPH